MTLNLTVLKISGEPVENATVQLENSQGKITEATARKTPGAYTIEAQPGKYYLQAQFEDLVAPTQTVEVQEGKSMIVYVGKPDWPYYRLGRTLVPFEPHRNMVAVTHSDGNADDDDMGNKLNRLSTRFALSVVQPPIDKSAGTTATIPPKDSEDASDGGIILLKLDDDNDTALPYDEVFSAMGSAARVGTPINTQLGEIAAIDRDFVVRFQKGVNSESEIDQAGADVVRRLVQAPNSYLIRFRAGHPLDLLKVIEKWFADELLVYGEPDVWSEMKDDAFPYSAPDDPTYPNQANLTLQRIDEAWRILADIDPKFAAGNPRIYVASLDRGIDVDHPDLGTTLTDGTAQLSRCFDFSGMRECSVAGYTPDTSHGMGVYGIIGSSVDNNEDIAGIAANTHHIGLERSSLSSANYADILLWAAGFETGNTTTNWPEEPLQPAADIISCSHGSNNLALSGVMDDTYTFLAKHGRNGLGTIVVYSAGNDNRLITGYRTWAAHPATIAVANSTQPVDGVERKVGTSNFGPEIDVCAQGQGAPSLNHTGGEQTFGGTSAAAPTVAAVAALMLSADPMLTARQLREILRTTAVQIDADNTDPAGRWINGFSQWYGYGRIDAVAAVEHALPSNGRIVTDMDGDGATEIPVTSPWGIGLLKYLPGIGTIDAIAMKPNGSRLNGWLLNTRDNQLALTADLDGDGAAEYLVTSPWGIGVLNLNGNSFSATMLKPNGTRFGGWQLNTRSNRFGPIGDFDGDNRSEFMVASPWGIGVFKLDGDTFSVPTIKPNGTFFGEWLLNTDNDRLGPVGDFDGDGVDEIIIRSPWGIGMLKLDGDTFSVSMMKPNGTLFGEWLLNTDNDRFGPVGDFDGDGIDELIVRSPWGIGILKLSGDTFTAPMMKPNGTRLGAWRLNTANDTIRGVADFSFSGQDQLFITSDWGIGVLKLAGDSLDSVAMARNGNRFNGWLLNTRDNHFKHFADLTGDGKADVLLSSPWGIGILGLEGSSFKGHSLAPNGTQLGEWLLDTRDNRF